MLAAILGSREWRESRECVDFYYKWKPSTLAQRNVVVRQKPRLFDRNWFVYQRYRDLPHWMRLDIEVFMTNNTCSRMFKGGDDAKCPNPSCKRRHHFGLAASYLKDEDERERLRRTRGLDGRDLITGAYAASLLVFDGCFEEIVHVEAGTTKIEFISDVEGKRRYPCFTDPYEERLHFQCRKCGRDLLMRRDTFERIILDQDKPEQYSCRKHADYYDLHYQVTRKRPLVKHAYATCSATIADLMIGTGGLDQMRLTWKRFFQYWQNLYLPKMKFLLFNGPAKVIQRAVRSWMLRRLEPVIAEYGTPGFQTVLRATVRNRFYLKLERALLLGRK